MTAIPCRRPRVRVNELLCRDRYAAVCDVPGCGWHYDNVVKSDVQQQASFHRAGHCAAVPATHVEQFASGYWQGHCTPCRWWTDGPGLTKAQAQLGIAFHLATEHGLVVCA